MPTSHQHPEKVYATVDEILAMLQKLSADGRGHYLVGCSEYWAARKDTPPYVYDDNEHVDLGGYL